MHTHELVVEMKMLERRLKTSKQAHIGLLFAIQRMNQLKQ
jgi:hypothetical protein